MAEGLSADLRTGWLNALNNTAYNAGATVYVGIHTGDPGSAGTALELTGEARKAVTWTPSSAGSALVMSNDPAWTSWNQGTETINYLSLHTASTGGGNHLWNIQVGSPPTVNDGDDLTLTDLTLDVTPDA